MRSAAQLPDDHELELLTDYVGGFMSDEQVEEFENRLMRDEDFFSRMEPFLDEWYAPGVLPAEIEIAQRLGAERGTRVIPLGRRLGRYRRHVIGAVTIAAAAAVSFALISPRRRAAVAPPTHLAQHVAPRDTLPGPRPPAPAPTPSPRRPGTSGHSQLASRAPVVVVIRGETLADSALADSAMRAAGLIPSAQSTRSSAVVPSEFAPIPITAYVDPSMTDSSHRSAVEKATDMTNSDKTSVKEGAVSRRWWQKAWDWIMHVPPSDLVKGGRTG
jgi:hypothetical protein